MNKILISDPTLRDGNHAIRHQITISQIEQYAAAAEKANIDILEVGHGNGLGASSDALGHACESDIDMMEAARKHCNRTKLGVHFIPGLGKDSDLDNAIAIGVDIFRIASHCTEANITRRYIERLKGKNITVFGVLMMAHMADETELCKQALLMQGYGADAVILMDSAGFSTPNLVKVKVAHLVEKLTIAVGVHAHNNLGLAVANSLIAVENGATIVDGCSKGFGAGAGNTQLEVLIAVLEKENYPISSNFKLAVELVKTTESTLTKNCPEIKASNIATGLYGLFSGYVAHVERISKELNIDPFELYRRLASRKLVAGQEDIILEEANRMLSA